MHPLAQAAQPGTLDALVESIQSLPWAAHALAIAGLTAGLILWAMGRRVLRPIFCVLGAITGAGLGFVAIPSTGWTHIGSIPSPFVGLFAGGTAGAVVGFVLYRFAVAISFAVVASLAGVLISAASLQLSPQAQDAAGAAVESYRQRLAEHDKEHVAATAPRESPVAESPERRLARDAAERAQTFLQALGSELQSRWTALPARSRFIVLLSGVAGLGIGFLTGLVMPARSAAAVTAAFGSAVWIPSGVWLSSVLDLPGRGLLDLGPTVWLAAWVVVAAIGFVVQMTGTARRKGDASGKPKPHPDRKAD
jgi:hypothetical protein